MILSALILPYDPTLTPEKRARLGSSLELEISRNGSNGIYSLSAGCVASEHHVEIRKVALFESRVEIRDLLCRCLGALPLLVTSVVTC